MSEAEAMQDLSDEGLFDDWEEPVKKKVVKPKRKAKRTNKVQPGVKVNMQCHCGKHYQARKADLLRGWGLSCSKRCAAIRREFGRPAATILGELRHD